MKSAVKMVMYPASGLVLFVISLCVILGAKKGAEADAAPVPTVGTMRYLSSEELSALLREARALKQKAEAGAALLAEQEARIGMLKKELQKEKEELLQMRKELDARHGEVGKAEKALSERFTLIEKVEMAGLQRSAAIHEAMDPKKAAAALAVLDQEQAAKILALAQEKKAARILQEMTPEAAAELLWQIKRVKADLENTND
jgi:flagellar motility protein MotE (MotC chaperone)